MSYASESKVTLVGTNYSDATPMLRNETYYIPIAQKFVITRLLLALIVASDTDACTVTVTRRVTAGSDVGAVSVDTIEMSSTLAAGKVAYVDLTPTVLDPGDELKFVANNNGGGIQMIPMVEGFYQPETPANCSDMVVTVS